MDTIHLICRRTKPGGQVLDQVANDPAAWLMNVHIQNANTGEHYNLDDDVSPE